MVIKMENYLETAFDSYQDFKLIGQGGNGIVYEASNSNGDLFAVKVVNKDKLNTKQRKRFKNEIAFCQKTDHKNIIKIIDSGVGIIDNKEVIFYVMPLYDCTLRDKMKEGLSPEQIIEIFAGVANGLKHAHSQGAIHRDIKPENILFASNSNEPVIADFGIAHFEKENLLTAVETKAADRLANFQYAAPEQRKRGGKVDNTTDLYSLALILNEMFTGEIPQAADYKTIASVNMDFDYLDDIFALLFKQNQKERLSSADELLKEFRTRASIKKNNKQIKLLSRFSEKNDEFPVIETKLSNIVYENKMLVFSVESFSDFDIWFGYLKNGSYNCTAIIGYEHNNLINLGDFQFAMPFKKYSNDERFIRDIVKYVKEWIVAADSLYNQAVKVAYLRRKTEEETKRIEEIRRLKSENSINDMLKGLI